jgi:hypothetical protein
MPSRVQHAKEILMADSRATAQRSAYNGEHSIAWIMGLAALILGAIGLLVGFGVIAGGTEDVVEVGGIGEEAVADAGVPNWQEGLLWLLPAVSAGMLALSLHRTEHHRTRMGDEVAGSDRAMFSMEHALAYLMALAAIATGVLGLLIGFDMFDRGNIPGDGYLWSTSSILFSIVSAALHPTQHHAVVDEDYVVSILERRTATMTTTPTTSLAPERPDRR